MASKKEEAEVRRRKANRYLTGASDKALSSKQGIGNVMSEAKNPDTKTVGVKAAKRRVDEVRPSGKHTEGDSANMRKERLDALRSLGEISDKDYKRRRKAM